MRAALLQAPVAAACAGPLLCMLLVALCHVCSCGATAAGAATSSMLGCAFPVQVRYPAYPSLVWYDVWEDMSGEWLAASSKLQQNWKRRMKAAGEVAAAVQATAAAADVGG